MSVINTNITSMIGQQNLNKSQSALQTSMERLSSGLRINSAKDDAAGQAIANRMSSQITGLSQAQRNANDGISVAQTAEGGLNQVNDNLQRIRELTVQAQNGTNSQEDLDSIQNEINQRLGEIDRISRETDFNGTKVLGANDGATDPTQRTISIQVGSEDGQTIDIELSQINAKTLNLAGFNVNGAGEVANVAATQNALTLAGAQQVGDTNEYQLENPNGRASIADVLGQAADGDVLSSVTVPNAEATAAQALGLANDGQTITVDSVDYTFDAASGNYNYSETYNGDGSTGNTSSAQALESAMTVPLGDAPKAATVTLGGNAADAVNILINDQGEITDENGQALYLNSDELTLTNQSANGTALTTANLSEALAAVEDSTLEIDGATYTTSNTNFGAVTGTGSSTAVGITTNADLETTLSGATGFAATVSIDGVDYDITSTASGTYQIAGNDLYVTDSGEFTQDATGNTAVTGTVLAETISAYGGELTVTNAGDSDLTAGDTLTGSGREVASTGLSVSTNELASIIDAEGGTFSFDASGGTVVVDGGAASTSDLGTTTIGGATAYVTAAGDSLTTDSEPQITGFDSDYTYSEAQGAFTYNETSAAYDSTNSTLTAASTAYTTLTNALTAEEGETVSAAITLGDGTANVNIDSAGNMTFADGSQVYLDSDNNLTATQGANTNVATIETVSEALLTEDGASVAIDGGATYTVDASTPGTATLTAEGLTISADALQDRLEANSGGTFNYTAADFDGEGNSQTIQMTIDSDNTLGSATYEGGVNSTGDEVYLNGEGGLSQEATISYFVQANGNVTNDSGQRIYQDAEGSFTTNEVTAGDRTEDALGQLDNALAQVDGLRSDLGAIQNRMESAIENLSTTETNLSAARSRIEDADYAVEVANMTRAQILQQAGTSVLAQANQIPQSVLSLLG